MKNIPEVNIYVRFCETDAAGHVSNVSYFIYLEEARTKFFELIRMGEIKEQFDLQFFIATTTCNYIKQAYAKQILSVTTKISKIGTKSFTMEHEILCSESRETIATGSAVVVCFNHIEQQSVPIPYELRKRLETYLITVP